tara:strand:+ start:125 stop:523 length:399 start_codon:yes stop_codon:yes gene_type:complete
MNSKLNWNTFVPADREEIGMVGELCGENGTLSLIPTNFNDTSKRVVIILKREDGQSTGITCSSRVSQGLRNKDITISNLFGFQVYNQINPTTGEEYPLVGMPSGAELMEFKAPEEATTYEAPEFKVDELVAF